MKRLLLLLLSGSALAQSSVNLTWTASTTPNTTVNVYRGSVSCSNPFVKIASNIAPSGPYVAGNLIAGGTYTFQVTAVLAGVESPPSNCIVITIAPPAPTVPAAPTALTATPVSN